MLRDLLPPRYLRSPEVCEMLDAVQPELDHIQDSIDDFLAQLNLDTATWALPLYEAAYGVTPDAHAGLDSRRAAIKARLRGVGTMTRQALQTLVDAWADGHVLVQDPGRRVHLVFVEPGGVPQDLTAMLTELREMTPAHLPITAARVYDHPSGACPKLGGVLQYAVQVTIRPLEE